jgi:acetyl-CoA carboxylase biotin carboxyl carrier protein
VSRGRAAGASRTPDAVTLARQLGALLGELGLSEIEVSAGDVRVRVARTLGAAAPAAVALAGAPVTAAAVPTSSTLLTVEAPMVGTFYRASSPTAEPFVREGDHVKAGQTLCIIEAMKLMNEIEARTAGRIVKILPDNGQPVEYGQPLFVIDPEG